MEADGPNSKRFVNWITDFLPDDIPEIRQHGRIFLYNYDSYWKRDAVRTRLKKLGNNLLEHINADIRASEPVSTTKESTLECR